MSPAELPSAVSMILAGAAMAAGAFIQGSVGFGSALVVAPLLALLQPAVIPGPVLAASFLLALLLGLRDRRAISVRRVGWALLGRLPGVFLGALSLSLLPEPTLRLWFGGLVLAAVAMSGIGPRLPVERRTLTLAGLVSGFMGTISSIGGPPMALLYQDQPGKNLRADLSAYFTLGSAMSLSGILLIGRFGYRELVWTLVLTPGVLVGAVLSHKGAAIVDAGYTRRAVLVVSAVSATLLLARELLAV